MSINKYYKSTFQLHFSLVDFSQINNSLILNMFIILASNFYFCLFCFYQTCPKNIKVYWLKFNNL